MGNEERIFKGRSGRAYRDGELDVSKESQRVDDRKGSTYALLLRVIEEFADIVAGQDASLESASASATWVFAMH